MSDHTVCPCCATKLRACPFCGAPAEIFAENSVGCSETVKCGGEMNFGHWCGKASDGTPAVHYVIEQWNKRADKAEIERLRALLAESEAERERLLNMILNIRAHERPAILDHAATPPASEPQD